MICLQIKSGGSESADNKSNDKIRGLADSDSEDDEDGQNVMFDSTPLYKQILEYLKPGETVSKALCRLGKKWMDRTKIEKKTRDVNCRISNKKERFVDILLKFSVQMVFCIFIFDSVRIYRYYLCMIIKNQLFHLLFIIGKGQKRMTTAERWKKKKEAQAELETNENADKIIKLTELANDLLTQTGNMDIYQETYEQIKRKVKLFFKILL